MIIYDWGTQPSYLLFHLAPHATIWEAQPCDTAGELIDRFRRACRPRTPFAFHLCLTDTHRWPSGRDYFCDWLSEFGNPVLNAGLVNVAKRRIQDLCRQLGLPDVITDRNSDPSSMVIIKTDWNYGGYSERRLSQAERSALALPCTNPSIRRFDEYRVCRHSEVPAETWEDAHLVVQRYIQNSRDAIYRVYRAGSRIVVSEAINREEIKKMLPNIPRKNYFRAIDGQRDNYLVDKIVQNSIAFFDEIGMQFGTLDVVVNDLGDAFIIDANPTPGWGSERQSGMLEHLAVGIDEWCSKPYQRAPKSR